MSDTGRGETAGQGFTGDAAAFERAVESETGFLYALARTRLVRSDLAADAVQETILKAWEHRETLRSSSALRPWLGSILVRTCISMRRRLKLEHRTFEERKREALASPPAERESSSEREEECAAALQKLDEQDQMIIALKYSKGLNYAQIAGQMGMTVDAVRGRLFRAREELRRTLKGVPR